MEAYLPNGKVPDVASLSAAFRMQSLCRVRRMQCRLSVKVDYVRMADEPPTIRRGLLRHPVTPAVTVPPVVFEPK